MSDVSFDLGRCPLCGESNECGMVAGRDDCWCTSVTIEKATLDRLPEAARGVVCVCARCVAADQGGPRRPLRVAGSNGAGS